MRFKPFVRSSTLLALGWIIFGVPHTPSRAETASALSDNVRMPIHEAKRDSEGFTTPESLKEAGEKIFRDALRTPHRVYELSLRGAGMDRIPADIGRFKNLKSLDLSHNPITELPPQFGDLANLEELFLSCTALRPLPDVLTRLPRLKRLEYMGSMDCETPVRLSEADALVLSRVPALRELELGYFDGTSPIPPKLYESRTIETIRYRGATSLSPDIAKLTTLRTLVLEATGISTLPKEVAQLKHLQCVVFKNDYEAPLSTSERQRLQMQFPKVKILISGIDKIDC